MATRVQKREFKENSCTVVAVCVSCLDTCLSATNVCRSYVLCPTVVVGTRQFYFNNCVRMSANKISYDDRVKPKNVLALNEKVAAIRRYEAYPVYKSVGRYFNCSPDQIKRIVKQKNEILAEWNNRTKKSVVPTSLELKSVKMSFLGKAVHEWIRRMMYYTDFNLTDALIQTMAIEFKKVLGLTHFLPDRTWIASFRSAYGLNDVNTKTLGIGYQDSQSVQIRDILRHLQEVCHPSTKAEETTSTNADPTRTIQIVKVKTEVNTDCPSDDVEMDVKYDPHSPSCSTNVGRPVNEQNPYVLPFVLPPSLKITLANTVATKPEPSEEKPRTESISTHDDAINCIKLLEEFALLKENFRLIGLIERLEEAMKDGKLKGFE